MSGSRGDAARLCACTCVYCPPSLSPTHPTQQPHPLPLHHPTPSDGAYADASTEFSDAAFWCARTNGTVSYACAPPSPPLAANATYNCNAYCPFSAGNPGGVGCTPAGGQCTPNNEQCVPTDGLQGLVTPARTSYFAPPQASYDYLRCSACVPPSAASRGLAGIVNDTSPVVTLGAQSGLPTAATYPCASGYWGAPELTTEVLRPGGWLRTKDTGFLDEGGNLSLVGRRTEMYIRKGYNVYPLEVENLLLERPDLREVAIIGAAHETYGEAGVAFLVPAAGHPAPAPGELTAFVRARLAPYKAPDEYRVVEALPRTAMLKIDKDALRRQLADEASTTSRQEGEQHG